MLGASVHEPVHAALLRKALEEDSTLQLSTRIMRVFIQHGACSILGCRDSDSVKDLKGAIERQLGELRG